MPVVMNPTAGDVHVNRPLTNFGQKYLQNATSFVSLLAMPSLPVTSQSDLYWEFDRGDFYRDTAVERADGTETAGGGYSVSTDQYFARVYGFHKDVSDRQRANQDGGMALDNTATTFVMLKLMMLRERLFLNRFLNTSSVWTGGASADQNVSWLPAGSNPITDIRTAIRSVQAATGFRPNKMLIGRTAWDTLVENDEILARISGGSTAGMPAIVQKTLLAQLFELQNIYVAESVSNTAAEGATDAVGFQAGDHAVVYYAPDTVNTEEPTAGVVFNWTGYLGATQSGMRVKRFRMEPLASDRVEGEMAFDQKVIAPELGARFTTVSA